MDTRLIGGAALAAALELVGHWFPWPKPLYKVHLTLNYIWGVSAILAGLAVATERKHWLRTAGVCAAAGLATIAAYIVDIHLHARQGRRINHERHG